MPWDTIGFSESTISREDFSKVHAPIIPSHGAPEEDRPVRQAPEPAAAMIKCIQHGHVYAMLSHPSAAFSTSVSLVIRDQEPQDGGNDRAISASLPSRRPSRQDTSMVGAYSSLANATQSVLDIMPWTLAATLSVRTCRILTRTSTTLSATWTGSQRDGAERGENLQLMPESTCKSAAWMSCRTVTAKEGVKGVNRPETVSGLPDASSRRRANRAGSSTGFNHDFRSSSGLHEVWAVGCKTLYVRDCKLKQARPPAVHQHSGHAEGRLPLRSKRVYGKRSEKWEPNWKIGDQSARERTSVR